MLRRISLQEKAGGKAFSLEIFSEHLVIGRFNSIGLSRHIGDKDSIKKTFHGSPPAKKDP